MSATSALGQTAPSALFSIESAEPQFAAAAHAFWQSGDAPEAAVGFSTAASRAQARADVVHSPGLQTVQEQNTVNANRAVANFGIGE
jgi:hypothetical protein